VFLQKTHSITNTFYHEHIVSRAHEACCVRAATDGRQRGHRQEKERARKRERETMDPLQSLDRDKKHIE